MSMSASIHSKNAVQFKAEGYAPVSGIDDKVYPVVSIEFRDAEGIAVNSVSLFASIQQLEEIRKAIDDAIVDYNFKLSSQLVDAAGK